MAMTWCLDEIRNYFYKVVNIIQGHVTNLNIYFILFYKLLLLTSKLSWCFKDTPNTIYLLHLIHNKILFI